MSVSMIADIVTILAFVSGVGLATKAIHVLPCSFFQLYLYNVIIM